jgi:hypothetical protein
MSAKVFISWSGQESMRVAEVIRNWLPGVIQAIKPYFSAKDIEKGSFWNSEITSTLNECNIGILCINAENYNSPWISFEAGALSKSLGNSKVCPLLFGISPTDVSGPLASFQATKFEREDFRKLIHTINNSLDGQSIEHSVLENSFDLWWPQLDVKIIEIMNSAPGKKESEERSTDSKIDEITGMLRSIFIKISETSERESRLQNKIDRERLGREFIEDYSTNSPAVGIALLKMGESIEKMIIGSLMGRTEDPSIVALEVARNFERLCGVTGRGRLFATPRWKNELPHLTHLLGYTDQ